ncbi:hypothetical protein [Chryseobacterium turcicum]|uniref:Uncharacterized protein n=1 Tax=Chryseobacterium turcicum TaxID=2898076 RepID=A0A9Q3YWP2_9FLAO|nr:hypothetical protein [Chryseobacterium turcicum]MCD1116202.1 hypothetical protein [Chryseobacterium turcicum]
MIEDLLGTSTVKRRKAAIEIRKKCLFEYKSVLLDALKLEYLKKHNETEMELIRAIGELGDNKDAKVYIKENYIDKGFFLRTAVMAYCRLERENNNDVTVILDLIMQNIYSMSEGALEVLGYDKMTPSITEQEQIIDLCKDFGKNREKGLTDPRYGLAAACAGWNAKNVKPFLEECMHSNDEPLKYVAENSLKGKYVKLR